MKKHALNLLTNYLPPHEVIYCDSDSLQCGRESFFVSGIAVKLADGREVLGSSSAYNGNGLVYAAYEVLERYALIDLPIRSTKSSKIKYSVSNGIALHQTVEEAKRAAFLELAERNEVLKSWFYNTPIRKLSSNELNHEILALEGYLVSYYEFSNLENISVVGVFAFPVDESKAVVYGFGASTDIQQSSLKAVKEFRTRFGFIHDEVMNEDPQYSTTSDYHQDFYLHSKNKKYLQEWLDGENKKPIENFRLDDVTFDNLTPPNWTGLYVFRAVSKDCIDLFFGNATEGGFDFPWRCDIPHPIM